MEHQHEIQRRLQAQTEEARRCMQEQIDEALRGLDTFIKARWWKEEQLSALLTARDEVAWTIADALLNQPAIDDEG